MHDHSHILIWIVEQCCTMFTSSEASELSTIQIHVIKFPDVGSVLSAVHALDQSANFVFAMILTILCRKLDVNKSLGCSLEMCSADVVVSQLQWFPFVRHIHRHRDRDKHLHRFEKWHCSPTNLFTSRGQHKIFGQTPTVHIISESSSFLQDLIMHKRDFWYWSCNLFKWMQLITFIELFSKSLQNRCNQFWTIRVQTTYFATQDSSIFSKIPVHGFESSSSRLFRFSNCLWRNPLCSEHFPSILISSSEQSICAQVL